MSVTVSQDRGEGEKEPTRARAQGERHDGRNGGGDRTEHETDKQIARANLARSLEGDADRSPGAVAKLCSLTAAAQR